LAMLGGTYGRYMNVIGDSSAPQSQRSWTNSSVRQSGVPTGTSSSTIPGYKLVITAPSTIMPRIRDDIAVLDRPQRQVMLEASVIEISQTGLTSLGVDWATKWLRFDLSTDGPQLVYSKVANTELVAITALLENGKARLRANPRIATVEDQVAELEVGKENYFQILSGSVSYQVADLEKITSGILLRITPHVIGDTREILTTVEPEVRDVTGKGSNGLPEITFRRAATTLRVPDGQSIVIGGLLTESTTRNLREVPVLGRIPLIGYLFRRYESERMTTEVVILITPHLVDDVATLQDHVISPDLRKEMPKPATPVQTPEQTPQQTK
ncbi:MAG TPA: hypothetical protein VHV83_03415, partial [Armatimonadota bacterium]|nr:hypothetical protein [Armatimonadota bacterium]